MATFSMNRIKAETELRSHEDKKEQESRRTLLTLCVRYLQSVGYAEAAAKVIGDTGINLDNFDVADNIDLGIILKEFEEYYNIKYGKPPKLLRKNANPVKEERKSKPPITRNKSSATKKSVRDASEEKKKEDLLELQGKKVQSKPEPEVESNQDFYENRLLKPLPDFPGDLRELAQSIYRDIITYNPNISFAKIMGLDEAKRLLKEAVLMPMKYPHLFTGLLEPWKGILLFGPPGTGKTMLAKAVATECRTTFFNISASSIVSKWRGDSEKLIRVLFELARYYQPSTIFIDEIDSIMSARDSADHEGSRRMKTELLIQLDGLVKSTERVFLLAASNLPWDLDAALLRRLEKRILVPLPSQEAKEKMLSAYFPQSSLNFGTISRLLESYSGSDIRLLCKEAAMKPLRRLMNRLENMDVDSTKNWHLPADPQHTPVPEPVSISDIQEAIASTRPSYQISEERYTSWFKEFGSV